MSKFEKTLSNPFFKYCRRFFLLVGINFVFCVISLLSCMVLFFPGLVSLHKICFDMIHDQEENIFRTFFLEIKRQWSFSWRLSILGFIAIGIVGGVLTFNFIYLSQVQYDWIVWFSIIFFITVGIVLVSIYLNLMLYNSYYYHDTFFMMIKKSAVISIKKLLHSVLNIIFLACFGIVLFLIPYLIPFLSFSLYVYLLESFNQKLFTEISRVEYERSTMSENLFLPVVKEDKENEK